MDEKLKLYAPKSYWDTPKHVIDALVNGCGPGKFGDYLVPDTLYGLSVKAACRIHDWMYAEGETIEDKDSADRTFLNNMLRIIYHTTKWWILRKLRVHRAYMYYKAVKKFGGPAFWKTTNPNDEYREANI